MRPIHFVVIENTRGFPVLTYDGCSANLGYMSLKRKKRVLAIDDEPSMTEWLKDPLEHAGYEVRTALIGTRGERALQARGVPTPW
jgi:PleD family two-component response regulator